MPEITLPAPLAAVELFSGSGDALREPAVVLLGGTDHVPTTVQESS